MFLSQYLAQHNLANIRAGVNAQRGAVLVVTLILLLILTLLVLSGLESSRWEERISANIQKKKETFQSAESAIEQVIKEGNSPIDAGNILAQSMFTITPRPADGSSFDLSYPALTARAETCYDGAFPAMGYSQGEGSQSFMAFRYKIRGRGEIPSIQAISTNLQGVEKIGPSGGIMPKRCP